MSAFPFEWLMIRVRPQRGHALEGRMWACSLGQIASALWFDPPSGQQAMVLALEELHNPTGDRREVYQMLHEARIGRP